MKWQLAGDWPVGPAVIPAGTLLTGVVGPDGELAEAPKWNGITLPIPMPLNAVALDEEAALMMLKWYEDYHGLHLWHRLHFGPDIGDLDAIKARARASKHG